MDFGFPQSLNPPVVKKSPKELDSVEQDMIIKNIQKMLLLYHPEGCKSDLLSRFYKMRFETYIEPENFGEKNWKNALIKNKNSGRLSSGLQKNFEIIRALKLSTNSKIKKGDINEDQVQGQKAAKNIQTMLLLYYNDGLESRNLSEKYKEHFDMDINFNLFPSRTNNKMGTSSSWKETLKEYKFFSFGNKQLFEIIKAAEFVEAEEIKNVEIDWKSNPPNPNNSILNSLSTQLTQQIASASNIVIIPTHSTPFYITQTPQASILSPQPNSTQSQSTQPIVEALKNEAANEDTDTTQSTSSTQQMYSTQRSQSGQSQTHYNNYKANDSTRNRRQDYDSERRQDYKYNNGKNWKKRDHSYKNRDRYEGYKCICEGEYHDSECTYKGFNFNYHYRTRYNKKKY